MLNLHSVLPRSRANGPGLRSVLWFQGCRLQCSGCFNPATHPFEPRLLIPARCLAADLRAGRFEIEGITISGGEPMEQAEGLVSLLEEIRSATNMSVLLFSGYWMDEILAKPLGLDILSHVDVLIAGRYDQSRRLAWGLRGSANQTIYLLTDRYQQEDIEHVPAAEVHIDPEGGISISGVDPPRNPFKS